jgi:hypothetical protein
MSARITATVPVRGFTTFSYAQRYKNTCTRNIAEDLAKAARLPLAVTTATGEAEVLTS